MNYRRVMRTTLLRKVVAPLAGVILALAGCATGENAAPTEAGPCSIIANGTPAPKTAAAPASPSPGAVTTSRNISTNPEVATGYRKDMTAVRTAHFAVATANPLATRAACLVLNEGGTAADALVTAQAVLGLVEPQASGIGGGGFLLYYDAAAGTVQAYDGREIGAQGGHGELPAVDLRCRPHRAQARRPRVRAGPSAYRASCDCCRTSTPSTARQRGVTCSLLR